MGMFCYQCQEALKGQDVMSEEYAVKRKRFPNFKTC